MRFSTPLAESRIERFRAISSTVKRSTKKSWKIDELRPQGIARVGLGELLDEVTVGKALQVGHGVITSRYWENIWVCGLSVGGRLCIIEGGMGSEKCVADEVRSEFKVYS